MESVIRSVKRVCYAGLDSVRLRQEVAARLSPAVAFDAYAFGTLDPDTGLLSHLVTEGMPVSLAREYADRLYPSKSALLVINAGRSSRYVFPVRDDLPEVHECQRANGFSGGVQMVLASNGLLWGKWCFLAESRHGTGTDRECALLRRLVPHLTHAMQQAALLDAAAHAHAAAAPDAPASVIVLDHAGRVAVRSAAACAMLDDLADVGVRFDDALPTSVRSVVAYHRLAARSAADGAPARTVARVRGRSGRWYSLQATLAEPDESGRSSTVVVVRPSAPREMAPLLSAIYGLSPREREVIAGVVRGETTKEIAARLTISPYTVKEHLDRACEKTGARGRRALVARLYHDVYRPSLFS